VTPYGLKHFETSSTHPSRRHTMSFRAAQKRAREQAAVR
jgi:hypothetical protein